MSNYPPFSEQALSIQLGLYEHYKGILCQVLGVSLHSETYEELVVYQKVKDLSIWVRPVNMFLEHVDVDGKIIPRFRKVRSK